MRGRFQNGILAGLSAAPVSSRPMIGNQDRSIPTFGPFSDTPARSPRAPEAPTVKDPTAGWLPHGQLHPSAPSSIRNAVSRLDDRMLRDSLSTARTGTDLLPIDLKQVGAFPDRSQSFRLLDIGGNLQFALAGWDYVVWARPPRQKSALPRARQSGARLRPRAYGTLSQDSVAPPPVYAQSGSVSLA